MGERCCTPSVLSFTPWQARLTVWRHGALLGTKPMTSRRLATFPGIGPITASAIATAVPNASMFRWSRLFAAWFGLTSRPHKRPFGETTRPRARRSSHASWNATNSARPLNSHVPHRVFGGKSLPPPASDQQFRRIEVFAPPSAPGKLTPLDWRLLDLFDAQAAARPAERKSGFANASAKLT